MLVKIIKSNAKKILKILISVRSACIKKTQVGWELKKRKAYTCTCIYLMYMWGKWWWNRLL